jgi:hypothetical protein
VSTLAPELLPFLGGRRAVVAWLVGALLVTFLATRFITRAIRSGRGPFRDASVGGVHVHHEVYGIFLLLGTGTAEFTYRPGPPWVYALAGLFGAGAALTLDEFALWLHLEDVYWAQEGRSSLDAVVLATVFVTIIAMGVRPVGLGNAGGTFASIGAVMLLVLLSGITFMKGRFILGLVALHLPFIGIYTACRLATPDSPWARWRYRGEKLARARRRFSPDRPFAVRCNKLLDLIGGAPTRD